MSSVTVCPQCEARFRVTPEQLAAKNGRVRCGRCSHIFNAFEFMVQEPAGEAPPAFASAAAEPTILEATPEAPPAAELSGPGGEPAAEATAEAEQAPVRVVRVQPRPPKVEAAVSPHNPKYGPPPKPRPAWPWALANGVLAAALAAQAAYFLRDTIAAEFPAARAPLEQACAALQCRVRLPQRPEQLGIDSSELHADPAHADIVILSSILRNRAAHAQAYPALELTLTNAKDEMVARRVFAPQDYLPAGSPLAQGIAAKGEVAVRLLLDLGDLKADGYRLYLFYPEA